MQTRSRCGGCFKEFYCRWELVGFMKGRNIMMPQTRWQSRSVITSKVTRLPDQIVKKRKREIKKLAGEISLNNIPRNSVYKFDRIFCCTFFNDSSEALSLSCVKFRSLD